MRYTNVNQAVTNPPPVDIMPQVLGKGVAQQDTKRAERLFFLLAARTFLARRKIISYTQAGCQDGKMHKDLYLIHPDICAKQRSKKSFSKTLDFYWEGCYTIIVPRESNLKRRTTWDTQLAKPRRWAPQSRRCLNSSGSIRPRSGTNKSQKNQKSA